MQVSVLLYESCALGDAQRHYYIDTGHAWKHIFYQSIRLFLLAFPSVRIAQGKNHSFWPWHSWDLHIKITFVTSICTLIYIFVYN